MSSWWYLRGIWPSELKCVFSTVFVLFCFWQNKWIFDLGYNYIRFWFFFSHPMPPRTEMATSVQLNCVMSWLTLARSWQMRKWMRWFERPTLMVMGRWIMKVSWLSGTQRFSASCRTAVSFFAHGEHHNLFSDNCHTNVLQPTVLLSFFFPDIGHYFSISLII